MTARHAARGEARKWLLAHVKHTGDGCLIWPFHRDEQGYGRIGDDRAHRAMCELAHGSPPTNEHHAAHTCGNGFLGCFNPRHVEWTTPAKNHSDKIAHGRIPRGENHYKAKLTKPDVEAIRVADLSARGAQRRLAKRYGVSHSTIIRLRSGESYQ